MTKSPLNRPLYYGTGMGDTIHAYTREEWGVGGSLPFGNNSAHTVTGVVATAALMVVPAIVSPMMFILSLVKLNLGMAILSLICTLLFTGGWILTILTLRKELAASKLRELKQLPKPRFSVTDDQAQKWFEDHPSAEVPITRENFPNSRSRFPEDN